MYHQHRHSLGEKMAAASRLRWGRKKNETVPGAGRGPAAGWDREGGGRKENQSMLFELCGGGRYSSLPHIFLCPPAPTYGGGSCIYYSFFAPHFAPLPPPLLQKVDPLSPVCFPPRSPKTTTYCRCAAPNCRKRSIPLLQASGRVQLLLRSSLGVGEVLTTSLSHSRDQGIADETAAAATSV